MVSDAQRERDRLGHARRYAENPDKYRAAQRRHWAEHGERWRAAKAERYAHNRAIAVAACDVPCADCGKRYPSYVMDFDHRPGTDKFKPVSQMARHSEKRLRAEIAKCDVVCSNCHRERTFGGSRCA